MEYACLLIRGELLEHLPSSRQECELEEMPNSEETRLEMIWNSEDSPAIHDGVKSGPVVETKVLLKQETIYMSACKQWKLLLEVLNEQGVPKVNRPQVWFQLRSRRGRLP